MIALDNLAERLATRLHRREADLAVFTDDYRFAISRAYDTVYALMAHLLASVRARHGVVGALGNDN